MNRSNDNEPPEDLLGAPEELVRALKRVAGSPPFIPPALDEAILRTARRQIDRPQRWTLMGLRLRPWAAAAATVLVLAGLSYALIRPGAGSPPRAALFREDLNRDGRVDILDAFALARLLTVGSGPLNPGLDVNGDGVVDQRDVTAIAAHAVQLQKAGRS